MSPIRTILLSAIFAIAEGGARLAATIRPKDNKARVTSSDSVAFFIHLTQDLLVVAPLIAAAKESGRRVEVWTTQLLLEVNPKIETGIRALGEEVSILSHRAILVGRAPSFARTAVLVTASESTEKSHRTAHCLVRLARAAGVPTVTLQHGIENVGLTYFPPNQRPVTFASDRILTWSAAEELPQQLPSQTRRKCVAVGRPPQPRPDHVAKLDSLTDGKPLIAVFENLHWERYGTAYSEAFLRDLDASARRHDDLAFVLRPHPGVRTRQGGHQARLNRLHHVRVLDPLSSDWSDVSSSQLLTAAHAVVATASTSALDAAGYGVPVAVARYGLSLDAYEPLFMLDGTEDWGRFLAASAADPATLLNRGRTLCQRMGVHRGAVGDAIRAIEAVVRH